MPAGLRSRRVSLGVVAVICLTVAIAAVEQQQLGWNELSHFSQVRALDRGTPIIDRYHRETGDRAYYHGHYLSDKAPGLSLVTLPVYHVARVTGALQTGGRGARATVHLLVLFGCVLPCAIIMLLALWLVERRDPGNGAVVGILLGISTLLLPFATLFFSHVLAACLGFAAFCLLWRERERGGGLGLIVAAGGLAGFAVTTEYPTAVLVGLLGLYVAWRPSPVRPLLAYGGGVFIGVLPLLLYDWWAFGGPTHLSYSYVAANSSGVLGLGAPSLRNAVKLLVADRGLLLVTPVVAAGLAGIAILWYERRRADALMPAAVVAAYFGYNACYYLPFGGGVPGPRFLITILPFLAVPLAASYRKAPITTLALGAVSAALMIVATLAGPILDTAKSTHTWWVRLFLGHFRTPVATVVVFGIFAVLAILIAARTTKRPRITRLDLELAVLGIGSWLGVSRAGPALLASDLAHNDAWGLVALLVLGLAQAAIITRLALGSRWALLAGIPLVALVVRPLDHTELAFCLAVVSIALLFIVARPRRRMVL